MTYYERAQIKRYKRRLEIKRNIILLLLSITIVLFIAVIMNTTIKSTASDDSHVVSYKYFKSIMIESGDSLWSIAQENMDYENYKDINAYIKDIKQMNSLKSNSIKAGSYLIIPYYSTQFKTN